MYQPDCGSSERKPTEWENQLKELSTYATQQRERAEMAEAELRQIKDSIFATCEKTFNAPPVKVSPR